MQFFYATTQGKTKRLYIYIRVSSVMQFFQRWAIISNISWSKLNICTHYWFLEHWNMQKSLTHIWQCFSCLPDEWIAKISKKKNFTVAFEIIHIIRFEMQRDRLDKSEDVMGYFCWILQSIYQVDKHCQICVRLFSLFQCSRNQLCTRRKFLHFMNTMNKSSLVPNLTFKVNVLRQELWKLSESFQFVIIV